jgi:hypothetical protein
MVNVAGLGVPRVALVGALKVSVTVSFGSTVGSSRMGTLTFLLVSPGAKVSVPLVVV